MSNVAIIEPRARRSITAAMADRYGMEPDAFEATIRATCMPMGGSEPPASREEFAAFLLVCREHELNPVTREIYAMRRRGGGIIPVVSIDGWIKKINEHPAFDGMEFEEELSDKGDLVSTTCRIYRKDRSHPIVVTEWLSECARPTDPWKMKHRMLRHKSAIQCGRYAFGFAGIYDEDEAERFAANGNARHASQVSRPPNPYAQRALPAPLPEIAASAEPPTDLDQGEAPPPTQRPPAPAMPSSTSGTAQALRRSAFESYREAALAAQDIEALDAAWSEHIAPIENELGQELYEAAAKMDDTRRGFLE